MMAQQFADGLAIHILSHERARADRRRLLVDALRELVRREGLAGMTVLRGLEGYSLHGGTRTSGVLELADDLPIVIDIVDRTDRIERILPEVAAMVTQGVLTVVPVRLHMRGA